ncbi:MAG TPA: secretin N-terminal domain-containing protein [Candidatus Omnitrophota bacterium]|nr:secretin N-terminal domain-containing protein [Candidatus Omnitrophota bacterium]
MKRTVGIRLLACLLILAHGASFSFAEVPGQAVVQSDAKSTQLAQAPFVPETMPVSVQSPVGMEGRISLDLRNIDVVDALKYLTMKAGINIITTKGVQGRVTLMVTDAAIQDVFDIMLRSNNLAYDKKTDIYNVMTQEEYRLLYGRNFSDVRQVKVFYLQYAIPEQAFSMLDMLKSEIGRVMVDPESGNILAIDSPARLNMMEQALKEFEEKNVVKVIKLNYAKAKDIEETLKTQLDLKKLGMIKADEKGNQLVIQTLPERMTQIEQLITSLDQKTKEIIIDVNIVKVKLTDDLDTGVQWEGLFELATKRGLTYLGSTPFASVQAANDAWRSRNAAWEAVGNVGSYPFSGTSTNYSSGTRSIGSSEMHLGLGNQDVDFILKFLQTLTNTKIMSNPKITVTNNQEAKIHVGQKEAYVTTTTTTGQTTNTVAEQVTFVDVGVMLSVVPIINDDGFINLKLKTEISSVIDTLITPTNNEIPIIDTSLAETTVLVKEGTTVVIGGLRKEQKTSVSRQTPILGNIPFLGRLFSVKEDVKEKTELLIILTPRIISGDVFVSSAAVKSVGQVQLKSSKGYDKLPNRETPDTGVEGIFIPDAEVKKLELKGPRKVNQ